MAVAEELTILVEAKTRQAEAQMKNLGKRIDATEKKVNSFGNALKSAIPAIGIAGVVTVGKQLIELASSASESANAISVVFGDAVSTIDEFGNAAAESIGLSKTEFNELSTVIGAQLKQSGISIDQVADQTVNLTRRAADLASVFNTSVTESTNALGAALRGESEPARRFGINISDAAVQAEALASGLVSSKSEITDQIKVQARLNLIFKQSNDVAGDFLNTSDGLANQQRILASNLKDTGAILGEQLIPAATDAIETFNDFVGPITNVVDGIFDFRDSVDSVLDRLGPFREAVGLAVNPVVAINNAAIKGVKALGNLFESEEDITGQLQEQSSQLGIIGTSQVKITSDAQEEAEARGKARQEAQRLLDLVRGSSDDLIAQARNVDSAIAAGILTEEEGLERKIDLREAVVEKLKEEAIASGNTTREVVNGIAEQETRIAAYQERLDQLNAIEVPPPITEETVQTLVSGSEAIDEVTASASNLSEELTKQEQLVKDLQTAVEQGLANSFVAGFGAVGEALVEGENAIKSFARAALQGFAAMLDSIAAQLAGYAVLGLFTTGGTLSGPALAGAAAAATAAGVTRASAASFQQGTPQGQPFTVPGTPGRDSQPIMVEPGEEVTVNPRSRSGGGSQMANVVLNIDGRAFGKVLLDLSRDRVVTIDRGALVAT